MTIRTIKVDITGLKEIEKAQKSVSALRDSVLDFERKLKKMGGKNTSPLSFNVNLNLNTDKALRDFLSLKKQIENIPINVRSTKGKTTESSVISVDKTQVTRPKEKVAEYVKVRDQDYQSWRNLHKAVQDVTTSTMGLSSQMIKLGAVNPAKGLLSVFNKVNSTVMGIQNNIRGLVGNKVTGALSNAIQGTLGAVKSGVGQLKDEANNLGDAMQVYRINMEALGFSEKETNKSIKRLGDYGKASVFDATDLLEQASTYTAYGRKDAESIVKGYAGLLAQTKNPVQGMKTVTTQTSQMLANGYLNQGDYRFIRERLSALGASKLNAELLKLAQAKGEDSITDATRKKLITANEYLDIVNKLGNEDIFQNLVTSIVTPRQAIANFKETLSNLLVFDEIDEEGNAKPGALNQVYVATRDFIKGITEIVGTDKFKEYVTKLGNAIGGTIQQVNQFGSAWKLTFGNQILKGIDKFASDFKRGVSGLDVGNRFFNITKDMISVLNNLGRELGEFTKNIVSSATDFLSSISKLTTQGINAGALKVLSQYVDVYNNLAKLAVKSEAIKDIIAIYDYLSATLNKIVKSINPTDVKGVFGAIRYLAVQVISFVETVATKTNLISNFATVIKTALSALGDIVKGIKGFNQGAFNKAVDSLREALVGIINHLKPLLIELGKGIIATLSSSSGEAFFKAVENFVKAVTNAIKQTLVAIGGSVEGGLKKLLDFLTLAINMASGVATLLGGVGKYILMGYIGAKFVSWATGIISSLKTVATAMNSVTGGRINPLGLGGGNVAGDAGGAVIGETATAGGGYKFGKAVKKSFAGSRFAYNKALEELENPTFLDKTTIGLKSLGVGLKQFGKYAPKIASVAKGLGSFGASLILDGTNVAVQNSGAPEAVKNVANVGFQTASTALTGFTLGGVPGAVIGGVIGFGQGLWENFNKGQDIKRNRELEEEQEKQAKQEVEESFKDRLLYLKQQADETAQIRNNFYKTITKDSPIQSDIVNGNALLEATKNTTNGTIESAMSSLGIAMEQVPKNVENLFVNLGDKVVSWNELKEQTGIQNNEELLRALQVARASVGQNMIEFVTGAGGEVVAQVRTVTDNESKRQYTNTQKFKDTLKQLGLTLTGENGILFKDIKNTAEELQSILDSRDFASKDDAKTAIISKLNKLGVDTTELVGKSFEEVSSIASSIIESGNLNGGTVAQQTRGMALKLSEKLGENASKFSNLLEKGYLEDLQKVSDIIDEANKLPKPDTEANRLKVIEFATKVQKLLKDSTIKVEEGQAILDQAGINQVSAQELKDGSVNLKDSVVKLVDDTTNKVNETSGKVNDNGVSDVSTSAIDEANRQNRETLGKFVQGIADWVSGVVSKVWSSITEGSPEDNSTLKNNGPLLGGVPRAFGGIIPEYHSQGLPVGINWQSRGTDTVPTMLTPGEYVLRKKAVDSLGTNFLNNLNKYGVNALQTMNKSTIINNVYNTNNAKISQNIDNKSQYLNGMFGVDKLMRYV